MKSSQLILVAQIAAALTACQPADNSANPPDAPPQSVSATPAENHLRLPMRPQVADYVPKALPALDPEMVIGDNPNSSENDAAAPADAVEPAEPFEPDPRLCADLHDCDGPIDVRGATCAVEGVGCTNLGELVFEGGVAGCTVDAPSAADCAARAPARIAVGQEFSCAVIDGAARCWGDDLGAPAQDGVHTIELPAAAVSLTAGHAHACAATDVGEVYCWGAAEPAVLGGAAAPAHVAIGAFVEQVAAGADFTCARSDAGVVKCWGNNVQGQLGQGHRRSLGDDPIDMGDALPAVDLDFAAVHLAAGDRHACALDGRGRMKCWGANDRGQLGLGHADHRGDQPGEMGAQLPFIELGFAVIDIDIVGERTCVLGEKGEIACWSDSSPEALPDSQTILSVGLPDAVHLSAGTPLCAIDMLGQTKCLQGDASHPIDFGFPAEQLAAGARHGCVLGADKAVACWGENGAGQLGHPDAMPMLGNAPKRVEW